jgi:hypothetical protein
VGWSWPEDGLVTGDLIERAVVMRTARHDDCPDPAAFFRPQQRNQVLLEDSFPLSPQVRIVEQEFLQSPLPYSLKGLLSIGAARCPGSKDALTQGTEISVGVVGLLMPESPPKSDHRCMSVRPGVAGH